LDVRVILGNVSYQFGIIRALKVGILGNLEAIMWLKNVELENIAALRCSKDA